MQQNKESIEGRESVIFDHELYAGKDMFNKDGERVTVERYT